MVFLTGCSAPPRPPPRLTILGLTLEVGAQLKQDALDKFSRQTGIVVDVIPTPGSSSEQLDLALKLLRNHTRQPDVILIDAIWPGTLHEHLLDLTPYLNDESHRHLPALLEEGTVGGRVIGLPFYMNTGMLYLRGDLLSRYGYAAPPNTWEEMARMALRIQRGERTRGSPNFWGYVWQGAAYEGLTCNALEWQASFGGGHIIERDATVSVNNPATIRAIGNAASWVGSISPPSVLSYTESDAISIFKSGHAAFMRHWSSAFRGAAEGMPSGTVGVAPLPAGPAGRAHALGGFHLAVSRYSTQSREAVALVLYLTGSEVEARRALLRGYLPTYPQLFVRPDLAQKLPQIQALRKISPDDWVVRPSKAAGDKYGAVSRAYYEAVHEILAGQRRAGVGLADLEQQLQRTLSSASGRKHVP